jgi:hypothetical protein
MPLDDTTAGNPADAGSALPDASAAPIDSAAPTSIEDTIRTAYRAQQKAAPVVDEQKTGEAPDGAEVVAEPPKPRTNAAGRLIDANGRFVKKDGTVVATEAEADVAPVVEQETAAVVAESQFKEPPKSWTTEEKAEWEKYPENLRAAVHRREDNFHKGIQQYRQFADIGTSLHKVIEPYGKMIVDAGHTAPALIGDLLRMQKVMTTGSQEERVATALDILRNSGVNIESLTQAAQQQPAVDPNIYALQRELQQLKGELQGQSQQRIQAEQAETQAEIDRFSKDGKHEDFNAVALDMSALLSQGRASNLQDAYDKAVWANPETRAKLLQKQEQDKARRQADEAAAARKAAGANVQRRGTPPAPVTAGTMDDTIRQTLRRINGGG